jgi:hypothetical protein
VAVGVRAGEGSPEEGPLPRVRTTPGSVAGMRRRWRGPLAGTATILVISVPVMVFAEDWRGVPLIDQAGAWWLLPAAASVAAFGAGGAVAARGRPSLGRALVGGLAAAVPAVAVLLAGDAARRAIYNPTLPAGVVTYLAAAAVVALAAALLGAAGARVASSRHPAPTRLARPPR